MHTYFNRCNITTNTSKDVHTNAWYITWSDRPTGKGVVRWVGERVLIWRVTCHIKVPLRSDWHLASQLLHYHQPLIFRPTFWHREQSPWTYLVILANASMCLPSFPVLQPPLTPLTTLQRYWPFLAVCSYYYPAPGLVGFINVSSVFTEKAL